LTLQNSMVDLSARNLNFRPRAVTHSNCPTGVSNEWLGMVMACILLLGFTGLKNNQAMVLEGFPCVFRLIELGVMLVALSCVGWNTVITTHESAWSARPPIEPPCKRRRSLHAPPKMER